LELFRIPLARHQSQWRRKKRQQHAGRHRLQVT
jgi:hypothetical protein